MADVADYAEWKTHRRSTAHCVCVNRVWPQAGLGNRRLAQRQHGSHYVGYSPTGGQPTDGNPRNRGRSSAFFRPLALLLGFFVLFFYRIDDAMEEQMKLELRDRRQP